MDTNTPVSTSRPIPFTFEGRAEDYFAIWIVNLLFTILTLGVYSAWAKVRRLQFFYGNTRLAGDGFSYLARPIVLLRARLLVLAVILLYNAAFFYSPGVGSFLGFLLVLAYPWIIHRSLRFHSRMTAWRTVRFDWHGSYLQAFKVFILWPIVALITFGIAFPFFSRAMREYFAGNHTLGHARFSVQTGIGGYYLAAGAMILVFFLGPGIVMGLLFLPADFLGVEVEFEGTVDNMFEVAFFASLLLSAYASSELFMALTRNIIINQLTLRPGHRFGCHLSGFRIMWIAVTNLLATVLSLGLLWPWTRVRRWRYLTGAMAVRPLGSLDQFIDSQHAAGVAVASEYADIEGFEFGL